MQSNNKRSVWKALGQNFKTDTVFWENEVAANLLTAKTMLLLNAVLLLSWFMNLFGVFAINRSVFNQIAFQGTLELVIPAAVCLYYRGEKSWLRYVLMLELTIVLSRIDSVLSYNVELCMVLPVVLSCRYYSQSFTKQISVITTVLFAVSAFCGAWFDMAEYNLMYQAETKALYVKNIMLQFFIPKWQILVLISIICVEIAKWGRHMVLEQAWVSGEHSRVETELGMAEQIQRRVLPTVDSLPRHDPPLVELSAQMEPAKEVGGDFYDFFYLDETHLALMIADVSGKGVPAALFMMASKLLLDNSLLSGKTPAQVLAEVNHQLCEKNMEGMFVTVWLGILDLETGDLTTANAGHEYPLLCRKDGGFEIIKDKHGFVLGGMDGMRYRETKLHLEPGDTLFVYTDGVLEANNAQQEQFGMDRTLQSLNANKGASMADLTKQLKADMDAFADQIPRFDDTTMLAVKLLDYAKPTVIHTDASPDSVEKTGDFVRRVLEDAGVSMKAVHRAGIIVDEIYSNVVNYSKATRAAVGCTVSDGNVTLEFSDNGTPYDPTQAEEPDITAALDDRETGGLGIFMAKKLSEKMAYRREDEENRLTVILKTE